MFRGESLSHFSVRNVIIWFTLAFQAGVLNAGGFLACHSFVTHVTGFATLFGTDIGRGNFLGGLGMLSVPVFFVLGAMLSAFLVDRRMINGLAPHYSTVMFLMLLLSLVLWITGIMGGFGPFGESLNIGRDYLLLGLLCFLSGLQNAMVTSASGAVVRTTHLTGITTDLGIGLVRVIFHSHRLGRETEIRATWMRIGVIGCFAAGSAVAAAIFLRSEYWGFIIPVLISGGLWIDRMNREKRNPIRLRLAAEKRA